MGMPAEHLRRGACCAVRAVDAAGDERAAIVVNMAYSVNNGGVQQRVRAVAEPFAVKRNGGAAAVERRGGHQLRGRWGGGGPPLAAA